MPFHDAYKVKPGDNLSSIARWAGFANPGPILRYPPNANLFRGRSLDLLRPGELLWIPYPKDLLLKIIATSEHLIQEVTKATAELTRATRADQKDLESFLFKIDGLNFLANLGVGIGMLAAHGARGGTMTAREAVVWFCDSRAALGQAIAPTVIPAPSAPKRDFRFYVRHALGPWNPSYWASVYTAISEGDIDIYLYGSDATVYKRTLEIRRQADQDIARLRQRLIEARTQLAMPFYGERV